MDDIAGLGSGVETGPEVGAEVEAGRTAQVGSGVAPQIGVARGPVQGVERQQVAEFDRVGHLRRARRITDTSQREMAARVGVAASTIARAETMSGEVPLRLIVDVLAEAGLRLAVVDADARPVPPMRRDGARDHGGRYCPAHLDAVPMTRDIASRHQAEPRYRMPARVSVRRRPLRDLSLFIRASPRPDDHVDDAVVEQAWHDERLAELPHPAVASRWRARRSAAIG